ncbi:aminoglycoside adenylyltransferase domain-containing protein [Agromyces sp. NBRC 114283]|uniref:aminoglycoside adenylyltransferase domain-containing protein n=1 Tax=Agromyces sp. NBRC 114283 TaxID=2994521 RepID=UPI0024A3431B|nr:aminoglycoside adenylyltransferase domain-containing protein [Agromyces sp. NBRC 114283]GLU91020.1 nucleotidyltransferase [Agromyces sp. NBRC 114283]
MDDLLEPVLAHLDRAEPGEFAGVYLYGSSVSGGLRPDSDVDLLVLTRRSLTAAERGELTRVLLDSSAWSGHADTFPEAAEGRSLELTCVVIGADGRWPEPAVHDYQFGEWLRADILAGSVLEPADDPDVPILLATAQTAHRVLRGAPLADVVQPVPMSALTEAMLGIIPDILEEIVGDERNTLLAFARIVTTLRTGGDIVPKDVAATAVAATLPPEERALMERARDGYLGVAADDWTGLGEEVTALSHALARQAEELAGRTVTPERE